MRILPKKLSLLLLLTICFAHIRFGWTAPSLLRIPLFTYPSTSSEMGSLTYAVLPRANSILADSITLAYPSFHQSGWLRALEWSVTLSWEIPWMVFHHELGHYRVGEFLGWNPEISPILWHSGFTRVSAPYQVTPTVELLSEFATSGVNQLQLNATHLFVEWAKEGVYSYQEALALLLAKTNIALYTVTSAIKSRESRSSDDLRNYYYDLKKLGIPVKMDSLVALTTLPLLGSASLWVSLLAQYEFLATGKRRIQLPLLSLGKLSIAPPDFHTLLTSKGPLVGGNLFFLVKGIPPLELQIDIRPLQTAFSVGFRAHSVALWDSWIQVSPLLRLSYYRNQKPGFMLGADMYIYPGTKRIAIIAGIFYQSYDLFAEPMGLQEGLNLSLSFGISIDGLHRKK